MRHIHGHIHNKHNNLQDFESRDAGKSHQNKQEETNNESKKEDVGFMGERSLGLNKFCTGMRDCP